MAHKSPPSEQRASSASTPPMRASMASKRKLSKRKICWDNGFKIRLGKPQPPKKKRKVDGAGTTPVRTDKIQSNPFEDGFLSTVHYNVSPVKVWEESTQDKTFAIEGVVFSVNQMVFVKPDSSQDTIPTSVQGWVAKILEIRTFDPSHVFLRVYWMYRPEDLPSGRQLYHGASELIASNDMAIIDALTVEGEATVVHWADQDGIPKQDQLFWRQTYDVITGGTLSELPKHCVGKTPCNPDEILVQCQSCRRWLHGSCLEREAVLEAYRSNNVPYLEGQSKTKGGCLKPGLKKAKRNSPAFTARIGTGPSGKNCLTVTDHRLMENNRWNVAVKCLLCNATIEEALSEEEEKPARELLTQLSENDDTIATMEVITPITQLGEKPDGLVVPRSDSLHLACGQNGTNYSRDIRSYFHMATLATNQTDAIIPISALSVEAILGNYIWQQLTHLFAMARTDMEWLESIRKFACDVYDFGPHLLHNDNISLLDILLALPRAEMHIPIEVSAIGPLGWMTQKQPSNPPLLPSPAVKYIHNVPYAAEPLARETSAGATNPSQELPPVAARPRPPDVRNPPNGQYQPRPPQDVQLDAIESFQTQISQNSDALAAQSRDMRRYKETQQHTEENLRRLQYQLDHQNSEITRMDHAVKSLQHELGGIRELIEGLRRDVHASIGEVKTTRGMRADPRASGSAQDPALELMNEVGTLKMTIESMKNKIQRLEDAGAAPPKAPSSAHPFQSPREPSAHTTQPSRAAPSSYNTPSALPRIDHPVPSSQRAQSCHPYGRQSVAAAPNTPRTQPARNSSGWVTVNSPAKRAHQSRIVSPHDSIGQSTGSPKHPKLPAIEPPVSSSVPQTWLPPYGHR